MTLSKGNVPIVQLHSHTDGCFQDSCERTVRVRKLCQNKGARL